MPCALWRSDRPEMPGRGMDHRHTSAAGQRPGGGGIAFRRNHAWASRGGRTNRSMEGSPQRAPRRVPHRSHRAGRRPLARCRGSRVRRATHQAAGGGKPRPWRSKGSIGNTVRTAANSPGHPGIPTPDGRRNRGPHTLWRHSASQPGNNVISGEASSRGARGGTGLRRSWGMDRAGRLVVFVGRPRHHGTRFHKPCCFHSPAPAGIPSGSDGDGPAPRPAWRAGACCALRRRSRCLVRAPLGSGNARGNRGCIRAFSCFPATRERFRH